METIFLGPPPKRMNLNLGETENLESRTDNPSSQVQSSSEMSTPEILQKFQREMMDKFLQFQRESEVRFLAWEQVNQFKVYIECQYQLLFYRKDGEWNKIFLTDGETSREITKKKCFPCFAVYYHSAVKRY